MALREFLVEGTWVLLSRWHRAAELVLFVAWPADGISIRTYISRRRRADLRLPSGPTRLMRRGRSLG